MLVSPWSPFEIPVECQILLACNKRCMARWAIPATLLSRVEARSRLNMGFDPDKPVGLKKVTQTPVSITDE